MTKYDDTAAGFETDPDRGPWTQSRTGRFYPLDPRPEEVSAEAIIHSLAQVNRFGGHADEPISVAQHSMQCALMAYRDGVSLPEQYALLMHDAAEAYVGDMQRPLKSTLIEFKRIEWKIFAAIKVALEIPDCDPVLIKYYDNKSWMWEKRDLFTTSEDPWPHTPDIPLPSETMQVMDWKTAKRLMTDIYSAYREILG